MFNPSTQPRILFVTPHISLVPDCSGENCSFINHKSSGFAGFLSNLVSDLNEQGADVHITQPDYRSAFSVISQNSPHIKACRIPKSCVHLTEDRAFYYTKGPESNYFWENIKISLSFQREVINHVLPLVQPDLIHCHDWMTGLIPAVAKSFEIPCIFSFKNLKTGKSFLSEIEDLGIDAGTFWQYLFFDRFPVNYEETRETNAIDFLLSGIFAAHHASIASPAALVKIAEILIRFPEAPLGKVVSEKLAINCTTATDYPATSTQYIDLYERLLKRPVLRTSVRKSRLHDEFHPYLELSYLSPETQIGA